MKILIPILLFMSVAAHAQSDTITVESLKKQILALRADHQNIKVNLNRANAEHSIGTMLLAGGAFITILNALGDKDNAFWIAGGGMMSFGTFFHIDSHKWLNADRQKRIRSK